MHPPPLGPPVLLWGPSPLSPGLSGSGPSPATPASVAQLPGPGHLLRPHPVRVRPAGLHVPHQLPGRALPVPALRVRGRWRGWGRAQGADGPVTPPGCRPQVVHHTHHVSGLLLVRGPQLGLRVSHRHQPLHRHHRHRGHLPPAAL